MPNPDYEEFPLTFEKGLVNEVEESVLEAGQASELVNWEPTAQGGLRSRNAWAALSKNGLITSPSIPTATVWLKADAIIGLTDGQTVATWEDSSPNNNDALQATEANKPTYQTNELNGKPCLRFDGSNDWMETAAFSGELANTTIFIVAKKTADGSISQALVDGLISGKRNAVINLSSHDWSLQSGGSNVIGSDSDASWHVFTAIFQGSGDDSLYVDGNFDVAGDSGGNALSGLTIGSRHDQALPFGGDIAEILVYDSALSPTIRTDVETYLGLKYDLETAGQSTTYNVRGFGAIATGTAVAGAVAAPITVQSTHFPGGIDADPVSTKTLTLNGVNIGNVVIAYVGVDSTATPTVTGGWTEQGISTGDEQRVRFYSKVATSSTEAFTYTITSANIRAMSLFEVRHLPGASVGSAWAADAVFSGSGGSSSNTVTNTDPDGAFTLVGYMYDGGTPDTADSGTSGWTTPTLANSNPRTGVAFEDLDQLDGFTEDSSGSSWSHVTPSWTPPSSGLVIILIDVMGGTTTTGITVTGNGLTWHDAADGGELGIYTSSNHNLAYAWADCGAVVGTTGTITVSGTQSASNPVCVVVHFVKAIGGDTTDPFVQFAGLSVVSSSTTGPTLGGALQQGSGILGIGANYSVGADDIASPTLTAGNWQAVLDTSSITDTVGFTSGDTGQMRTAYANSSFPPDTISTWLCDVNSFATELTTYEIKGSGNAARVYRGTVTSTGTMIEDFSFIADKRMVAKMVSWGYTPPTEQPDAVDFYIVMAVATNSTTYKVYRIPREEITTGTWESIDTITDATSTNAFVSFAQGAGHLIWTASTMGFPRAIELATLSSFNITDMLGLAGRTAAYHKDRMFIAGSTQNPSRVYFSDIGDPLDFTTATDFLDIGGDDGEAIQDLSSVEGLLLIPKTNRAYLVSGSGIESFFVNELAGGTAAPGRSAIRTPYGTILAGDTDIWVVQGGGVDPLSRPLGAGYGVTGSISTAYAQDSVLVADSQTSTVFRVNLVTGAWSKEIVDGENQVEIIFSLQGRLYYGVDGSTTQVGGTRRLSSGRSVDATSPSNNYVASTGRVAMMGPSRKYTPRYLYLQLRSQDESKENTLFFTVETNAGTTNHAINVTDATQREKISLGPISGVEWLQVRFTTAASNSRPAIDIERCVLGVIAEELR